MGRVYTEGDRDRKIVVSENVVMRILASPIKGYYPDRRLLDSDSTLCGLSIDSNGFGLIQH